MRQVELISVCMTPEVDGFSLDLLRTVRIKGTVL